MGATGIQTRVLRLFNLQPGQGPRTFLTAAYLCLVIMAYVMLKSTSKGLFIDSFGSRNIPYATIAIAALVGVFVTLYIRVSRRVRPTQLAIGTLGVFIASWIVFWWLVREGVDSAVAVFYVWVGMYGAVAATQVWTLANDLFTTREAKRVFGVVGAGGIFGAIAGGSLTGFLAGRIGAANLPLVAALLLCIAAAIAFALARYRIPTKTRAESEPPPRQLSDSLRIVSHSPHLRLVAMLVLITALATKMVDMQYTAMLEVTFDKDTDAITAFDGTFTAIAGIVGLLFQTLLTSRLLVVLGLGGTILALPLALTLGTAILIPTLTMWAAVILRGGDATLKHSIDRSSRELVYLPVSRSIKVQAKSAIDMVVDRCGDGLAGLVQAAVFFLLSGLALVSAVRIMGIVNLVFLALWLLIAIRLRRSYVNELSRSIAEGRVEVGSWHEAMAGADTMTAVARALDSDEPDNTLAALDLVAANPQWDLSETLCRLARDGSPEVRARALAILLDPANPDLPEGVASAFAREDQELLAECIDLQLATDPEERKQRAQAILDRAGGPARGAWIALMVRRLGPEFGPVARGLMEQLLHKSSPADAREVAATAIGMVPVESGLADLLPDLLKDDDPKVASAAARSAGSIGGDEHLAHVVPLLGRTPTRQAARMALQSRGDSAIPVLMAAVERDDLDARAKAKIPLVLSGIDSPEAMASLARLMSGDDPQMVATSSHALYRVRLKKPDGAMIPAREARVLILAQAARCSRLIEQIQILEQDRPEQRTAVWSLMLDSLRSAYARHHLAVFQTLCLCYSPRHIVNCRRSLVDKNLELRANAAELLDNLVPRKLWRELLPVLYREEFAQETDRPAGGPQASNEVLEQLAVGENKWLAMVAACLRHDRGAGTEPARGDEMGALTVVEKVVALQGVEVFKDTPPEQLALVAAIAEEVQLPAGTELSHQDDPPGDMWVVLEGSVSIVRNGKKLGELGSGEALGTWALFEDEPQQVTATASEETRALKIDRWGFDEAIDEHPEIARSLIRQLIQRLRKLAG